MLEQIVSILTGLTMVLTSYVGMVNHTPVSQPTVGSEKFGAFSPAAGSTYRTKTSVGISDVTVQLSSFTEPVTGNKITMSTLNSDIGYATLDPQSSTRKEFISFTGVTQNSDGSAILTGVSRGLSFQYPFTASSTLRKAHPGQSVVILSDSPQLFNEYARLRSNETVTGQWTFSTFPITPSTTPASATTTGWVQLATGVQAASSTAFGSSGNRLALSTLISTSSQGTSGNYVVVTNSSGYINTSFFPTTTVRTYTSTTTTHTWTKPEGIKTIHVQLWGAGGSGGRGANAGDETGGGGGGGYFDRWFAAYELASSSYEIVVGTGGAAKTADGDGNPGTASTFGSTLAVAYGGGGGAEHTTGACGGGGGGSFATGTTETTATCATSPIDSLASVSNTTLVPTAFSGSAGGACQDASGGCTDGGSSVLGGAGGGGAYATASSTGGTSRYGGSGGYGSPGSGLTAQSGSAPGGGGGGAYGVNSGAGARGQVIVTEYY